LGEIRKTYKIFVGKPERTDLLGVLVVGRRILFKW
jgi:hypothetical protein